MIQRGNGLSKATGPLPAGPGRLVLPVASVLVAVAASGCTPPRRSIGGPADSIQVGGIVAVREGRAEGLDVAYVKNRLVYAVEDRVVWASDDGASFQQIARLSKPAGSSLVVRWKDWVAGAEPVRRIRRNVGPLTLAVLESGTLLVFWDGIHRIPPGTPRSELVSYYPEGGFGPIPGNSVAVGPGDTVYLGEYRTDPEPHPVRVFRGTEDGRRWEVAFTFPSGQARHVHSITFDPHRSGYWIAVGDDDRQSMVLWTANHFESLDTLGRGSEDWRVVSLIVRPDALIWGSDNDSTGAGIYRFDFPTRTLKKLLDTGNPSYFSATLADGTLVISTTYEPASRYSLTLGPLPHTSLFLSRDGEGWQEFLRLPGEPTDATEGRRPRLRLPAGDGTADALYFTPFGTVGPTFYIERITVRWGDQ